MKQTNVRSPDPLTPQGMVEALLESLDSLSPQVRKAARFVADNPNRVGLDSIRKLADAAGVKPDTFVRLARTLGFANFEAFRAPFRQSLSSARQDFPDRARWLQSLARRGRLGPLFSDMAATAIDNVEGAFHGTSASELRAAARAIVRSRTTYVLGVGVAYSLAHMFAYLGRMALDQIVAVPRDGSLPIDDIARANRRDVLLAMSFHPYRSEVVQAITAASAQRVTVIGISDTRSSPITRNADHAFVLPTDTPRFFTSMVAATALLETLMAFIVAETGDEVVTSIDHFHAQRRRLGVYTPDDA